MNLYREEFVNFFPVVLTTLVDRKVSNPRVKVAYDHLEEVSYTGKHQLVMILIQKFKKMGIVVISILSPQNNNSHESVMPPINFL